MRVGTYLRKCRELGLSAYVELAKYENAIDPGHFYYRYEAGVNMGEPVQRLRLSQPEWPDYQSPVKACEAAWSEIEREQRRLQRRSLRDALADRLEAS